MACLTAIVRRGSRMLMRVLPKRLDRQIVLMAGVSLGLITPLFAIHEANESAERVVQSTTLQAKALAENIAVTSVEYVLTEDFSSTEKLLLRSARFPGVDDIQVVDPSGRIIADVYKAAEGPRLRYDIQLLTPPDTKHALVDQHNGFLTIWEPITEAYAVGWVKLTYSLAEAERIARQYLYYYLFDGLVVALLLVGLILLVMKRPLRLLKEAAHFATQLKDKRGERLEVNRSSIEIESLGDALNEASKNLYAQDAEIRKAVKKLSTQKSAMDEHSIVSVTDVEGNITYANQKFLDSMELDIDEVLGKDHSVVKSGFHGDAFYREMWQVISQGRVWHGEIFNKSKSGRGVWVNTTIVPFIDESGQPYEYVAIRTDISEQKKIEKELEEKARSLTLMTNNLEDLVRLRTTELEEANRQLSELNKIKSEFVSVVSHELRTPLTSIKSFAEILQDDIDELDSKSTQRFLSIINEEAERLGRLINDLLDLQKMESGKATWADEDVDIVPLLVESVETFSQACSDKGLTLEVDVGEKRLVLNLDGDRFKQLIINLLSNALKFTEQGGVELHLSVNDNAVNIVVADTGMGIAAAELDKVFDSFYQVDSSAKRKAGGSGLGLKVCKEIVEHYHGRIWVESEFGDGSRFFVTLPLSNERVAGNWEI